MDGLHHYWQVYFFISCWLLLVNPREDIVILGIMRVQYSSNLSSDFLKSLYSIYFGMTVWALLMRIFIFPIGNLLLGESRGTIFFGGIPLANPNYINLIPNHFFFRQVVLTSPLTRCVETALLAFPGAKVVALEESALKSLWLIYG